MPDKREMGQPASESIQLPPMLALDSDLQPVPHMFEAQARRTPDAVAVVADDRSMTFAELLAKAECVAQVLGGHGVRPGVFVALHAQRSVEMIIGLLGILKAGAAYVPLDPSYPAERLAYMLSDSRAPVIVTTNALGDLAIGNGARVLPLDAVNCTAPAVVEAPSPAGLADPAYLIYTSGSTGTPNGVVVTHAALSNSMRWMQDAFPLNRSDRVLQKTPLSFDASVWEVLAPLLFGATLVMARPDGHRHPDYLCQAVQRHCITTLQLVPTMLQLFLETPSVTACTSLLNVFSGGERLTWDHVRLCADKLPAAQLHNLYGPTEACSQVTFFKSASEDDTQSANVPIGKPIANVYLRVLDEEMRPVSDGASGELYIGGACLAQGYWNRAELTARRFLDDPYGNPGERLYRTGDIVRQRSDGNFDFLGRGDEQVKIAGVRIELGEIEAALLEHPTVQQAAVIRQQQEREPRLAAFVVRVPGRSLNVEVLREHLRQRLPPTISVSSYFVVEGLPVLPSGKLDRAALASRVTEAPTPVFTSPYVAPRTDIEVMLAELWSEVLEIERIGIDDDPFELGATSLAFVRVVALANERLGTSVLMDVVANGATITAVSPFFEAAVQQ
jgi:amino acid adenylation domain-containing protein